MIKQSQDDGAAEVVTWKISPVNNRLGTAKSRQFLGVALHPCSDNEVPKFLQFFCLGVGQSRRSSPMRCERVVCGRRNTSFLSDFHFVCVIDMVEEFLTRGYEEVAFISIGFVEVYCFRA